MILQQRTNKVEPVQALFIKFEVDSLAAKYGSICKSPTGINYHWKFILDLQLHFWIQMRCYFATGLIQPLILHVPVGKRLLKLDDFWHLAKFSCQLRTNASLCKTQSGKSHTVLICINLEEQTFYILKYRIMDSCNIFI